MSGAIAGQMIAHNIKRLAEGAKAASESWPALAARGLVIAHEPDRVIAGQRPSLAGNFGGVTCSVRIVTDFVWNPHTEVTATFERGVDAVIGVFPSPSGILKSVRDWLHQDVEIGAPEFDDAFLITAKPKEAAASLLTTEVRDQLVALAGGKLVGLKYDHERACVLLNGVEADVAAIEVALDIVVASSRWKL